MLELNIRDIYFNLFMLHTWNAIALYRIICDLRFFVTSYRG